MERGVGTNVNCIRLCVLKIFAEHGTFPATFGGVSMFSIIKTIFWDEKFVIVSIKIQLQVVGCI